MQDFILGKDEFFIPILDGIDQCEERENITRELEYTNGFLASVEKKLKNERFVNNAPKQVVASERKKLEDAKVKINALVAALANLN